MVSMNIRKSSIEVMTEVNVCTKENHKKNNKLVLVCDGYVESKVSVHVTECYQ